MKKSPLYLAFIAIPLMYSCSQTGNKNADKGDSSLTTKVDTVFEKQCFRAVDGKDTADLKLSTHEGKVTGTLLINYAEKGKNDGKIEGKYSGDTLFVDYTFKIGTTNQTTYKNPLALLKKDGKLVMGVGQIETTLGRSYFTKGKPISFEKGRFIFDPQECK
jgi:hypothetical protein